MDTNASIIYRNADINHLVMQPGPGGPVLVGSRVDSVDMSDVDVVQFMEKRSESDGMDAGDVFLGARRVRISGTSFDSTRALVHDRLQALRSLFSPTLAQRSNPGDKGYEPMYFSDPTNNLTDFPTGHINKRILVMPRAFQAIYQRDQQGGDESDALAVPWQATLVMRNPRIQSDVPTDLTFPATTIVTGATAATNDLITSTGHGLLADDRIYITALTGGTGLALNVGYYVIATGLTANAFKVSLTSGGAPVDITVAATVLSYVKLVPATGNFYNRGDYHAPLNMLLSIGAQAGSVSISAGGSVFTLTIPASTGTRLIRMKEDKVVTMEENSIEVLNMGLIDFQNLTTWPLVTSGLSPYTITFTGLVLNSGGHIWFYEAYA